MAPFQLSEKLETRFKAQTERLPKGKRKLQCGGTSPKPLLLRFEDLADIHAGGALKIPRFIPHTNEHRQSITLSEYRISACA